MEKYTGKSETLLLFHYFKLHPGLGISTVYLLLIVLGVLFSSQFYSHFDIPILKFLDLTDLIAVGFREPLALTMLASAIGIGLFLDVTYVLSKKREPKIQQLTGLKRLLNRAVFYSPKYRVSTLLVTLAFTLFYLWMFVYLAANKLAEDIKTDGVDNILVNHSEGVTKGYLLGTTFNYVFIYHSNSKATKIYTLESVNSMMPITAEPPVVTTVD